MPAALTAIWPAALVHTFTASGAICGFLAIRAMWAGAWEVVFAWLGLALVIDGIDGTFARLVDVQARLPRFSGERLDYVVDYVTYVFVPVAALFQAGFLGGATGLLICALILLASLYHFVDTEAKGEDHCFIGFPAIWNVVAFYVFAAGMTSLVASLLCLICIALTFVPMRWAHPLRTARHMPMTITVLIAGSIAGALTLLHGFPAGFPLLIPLFLAAAYGVGLAIIDTRAARRPQRS